MPDWSTQKGISITDATPTGAAGVKLNDNFERIRDEVPFNATSNPTVSDDDTAGYFAGSQWFNTSTEIMWICTDASTGAAVWRTLYKRESGGIILSPGGDGDVQLGDDLDVNGQSIVSQSNGDIPITPDGTGKVVLDGLDWPTADGGAGEVLKTDGAAGLYFGAGGGGGGAFTADGSYAAFQGANVDAGAGANVGSLAQGKYTTASGDYGSFAQGIFSYASGDYGSFTQGNSVTASGSRGSFAQGAGIAASGNNGCFAQGYFATASGNNGSFAQGTNATASGYNGSFAQGQNVTATGDYGSFAQGIYATASGTKGCFAQGEDATANGFNGCFVQGRTATCSGINGATAQGYRILAAGSQGCFAQGAIITASGNHGSFAQGLYATASADTAWAVGRNTLADKQGQFARSTGSFSSIGDAQMSIMTVRRSTTDATVNVVLTTNGATPGASNRLTIPSSRSWAFLILLSARQTAGTGLGDTAAYRFEGSIKRDGSNNTAIVGSVTKTVLAEDDSAWDADVVADDTNEALQIQVTGVASHTIHWLATVYLSEVG